MLLLHLAIRETLSAPGCGTLFVVLAVPDEFVDYCPRPGITSPLCTVCQRQYGLFAPLIWHISILALVASSCLESPWEIAAR